mgnify:CR=1 FL=1
MPSTKKNGNDIGADDEPEHFLPKNCGNFYSE